MLHILKIVACPWHFKDPSVAKWYVTLKAFIEYPALILNLNNTHDMGHVCILLPNLQAKFCKAYVVSLYISYQAY